VTYLAHNPFGVPTAVGAIRQQVAERLPGGVLHQAPEQSGALAVGFGLLRFGGFKQKACQPGCSEGELSAPEWLARKAVEQRSGARNGRRIAVTVHT